MKKFVLLMVCVFVLIGCSAPKYSQKEQPFKIEVNTKKEEVDKSIKSELLKNDKVLEDSEKELLVLEYDEKALDILGEFDVNVKNNDKEILTFKVKVQDTTKPTIKLEGTEFELGTEIESKITLSDNYDKEDVLKKSLTVKGYDKDKEGEQEITISTTDSSKNETIEKITITLIKKSEASDSGELSNGASNSNNGSNVGGSSSNQGTANGGGNNLNSGGNSGSTGGGWTPPAVEEPVTPPAACPGGMDPSLPCNWTPNSIGNTGLLFDTEDALYAYTESKGWAGNTYQVLCLNYNDGSVKYSINKY